MSKIDWIVLVLTLLLIISYGLYRSRASKDLDGYFRSNRNMPWYLVLLSIMGTQASAITFLSAPGQAYTDGMRFVQYYFGLPIAMVIIAAVFVPVFSRLNVYTAYEYLEHRFDVNTRTLTSILFLISRGLSTGISIFAPSIILSSLFGWNIYFTNIVTGGFLIIYTVSGGARAVAYTQQLQFVIIFTGLFLAGYLVVNMLPADYGFTDALYLSGAAGKLNVFTSGFKANGSFDWSDKYNIWSGIIGGCFLALSYFGTDQSQVGRYLTAKSMKESRIGLLMNGLVKVPMQFLILMIGALVFSFYQFYKAPVFFNENELVRLRNSSVYADSIRFAESEFAKISEQKQALAASFLNNKKNNSPSADDFKFQIQEVDLQSNEIRNQVKTWIASPQMKGDNNDANYIFLRFVIDYLPKGLVGLLIAIIFIAAWGSIAAALNSLAGSTIIDIHKRLFPHLLKPEDEYKWSKLYTLFWGIFCIIIACFAYNIGNSLIEAVNILGSLFYGTLLGIFLTAFFLKRVGGKAVFYAALVSQILVFVLYAYTPISFLWYNLIGCLAVMILSLGLSFTSRQQA